MIAPTALVQALSSLGNVAWLSVGGEYQSAIGEVVTPFGVPPLERGYLWSVWVSAWVDGRWEPFWNYEKGSYSEMFSPPVVNQEKNEYVKAWTQYATDPQWDYQDLNYWTLRTALVVPGYYYKWANWAWQNYRKDIFELWGQPIGYQLGGPIGAGYGYAPARYNGNENAVSIQQINNRIKAQTAWA